MRGRWAAGIVPRNFAWIIKDRLAVAERPGGYAPNHRKVRRYEELLWLRAQGFDRIVSLLGSSHNLHAYDEVGLVWSHFPMPAGVDLEQPLTELYQSLYGWLRDGERILVHQDELGDRVMGVVAGYLRWSSMLPDEPTTVMVVERLLKRQMGRPGRIIVTLAGELPGAPGPETRPAVPQRPVRPGEAPEEAAPAPAATKAAPAPVATKAAAPKAAPAAPAATKQAPKRATAKQHGE